MQVQALSTQESTDCLLAAMDGCIGKLLWCSVLGHRVGLSNRVGVGKFCAKDARTGNTFVPSRKFGNSYRTDGCPAESEKALKMFRFVTLEIPIDDIFLTKSKSR